MVDKWSKSGNLSFFTMLASDERQVQNVRSLEVEDYGNEDKRYSKTVKISTKETYRETGETNFFLFYNFTNNHGVSQLRACRYSPETSIVFLANDCSTRSTFIAAVRKCSNMLLMTPTVLSTPVRNNLHFAKCEVIILCN